MEKENSDIDIGELLFLLRKRWKLLLIASVAFALAGLILSKLIFRPVYESSAMIVVTAGQSSQTNVVTYDQLNTAQQLVNTCVLVLESNQVLNQVNNDLNLGYSYQELSKSINISGQTNTEVIKISVKNPDPQLAATIANQITKIAPGVLTRTVKAGSVEVVSTATPQTKPVFPNITLNMLLAFLIGLGLSIGYALLMEKLDNTFTTEEDVQNYLGLSVLGVIPSVNQEKLNK